MMANSGNSVPSALAAAKPAAARRTASSVDEHRSVSENAAPESRDAGESFNARMQDAANAQREAASAQRDAANAQRDSANAQRDAASDPGDTTPDAKDAAVVAAATSATVAAAAAATQLAADQLEAKQDAAASDAATQDDSVLAAQLLSMLAPVATTVAPGNAAATPATSLSSGPAGVTDNIDSSVQGTSTESSTARDRTGFSLERYAKELERAAATPLPLPPLDGGSRDGGSGDGGGKQSASAAAAPGGAASMNAALQLLTDNLALHRSPVEVAPRSLEASVGSKAWQEQLGSQLTWMIDKGEQLATLRLSPEHLGPLEVKIAVRESEATVWFGATQPETRAALEQAMPRLRDMLASQGIALMQSGVSSGSPQNQQRSPAAAGPFGTAAVLGEEPASEVKRHSSRGLVDLYA